MSIALSLGGNYNYGNLLTSGSIGYDILKRKIRGNGKIRTRQFGSLHADYDKNEFHLYSRSSFLTRCMSKLGYLGYVGAGILGGLSCYLSVPADDPYRTIGAIGAGLAIGLISFFTSRKLGYRFKL
jgi:hypothetical protein